MYCDLVISTTEDNKVVLDIYNTTIKSTKNRIFRKRKSPGKVDVVMASYLASKEQVRQLIDMLEDTLEELENPADNDSDKEECY